MSETKIELPRDNLLRGRVSGVALRADGTGDGGQDSMSGPVMVGHFAVFNQWTEINSWEGNFLEMFAPRAFKKTIADNRGSMKVLFQHGYDYVIGDKPLGPIETLEEDSEGDHVDGVSGAWYEVPLLDAPYCRQDLMPGLEAGLYGASFRFRVIREEIDEEPEPSDYNPQGLPERVVKEAHVMEFGPVTFPQYPGASAGLRSLEAGELVAQAALERMERQDAQRSHNLAARFATRSESTEDTTTSRDEPEESGEDITEQPAEPEVTETEGADVTPEPEGEGDSKDAPPQDSAELDAHPDPGRRVAPPWRTEDAKAKPPWHRDATPKPPWHSGKE